MRFRIPNNYEDIGRIILFNPAGRKVHLTRYFSISSHQVDSPHRPLPHGTNRTSPLRKQQSPLSLHRHPPVQPSRTLSAATALPPHERDTRPAAPASHALPVREDDTEYLPGDFQPWPEITLIFIVYQYSRLPSCKPDDCDLASFPVFL